MISRILIFFSKARRKKFFFNQTPNIKSSGDILILCDYNFYLQSNIGSLSKASISPLSKSPKFTILLQIAYCNCHTCSERRMRMTSFRRHQSIGDRQLLTLLAPRHDGGSFNGRPVCFESRLFYSSFLLFK